MSDPVEAVARALCCGWECAKPERCRCDFKAHDASMAIAAYHEALEADGWQVVPSSWTDEWVRNMAQQEWRGQNVYGTIQCVLDAAPTQKDRNHDR